MIDEVYKTLLLLPFKLGLFSSIYSTSEKLHDGSLLANKKVFQQSAVPTIIMVNQYDPITPPENGYIFKKELTNGQLFILDAGGHGGGDRKCRNKVMINFMDDPNGKLNTSCLNLYKE